MRKYTKVRGECRLQLLLHLGRPNHLGRRGLAAQHRCQLRGLGVGQVEHERVGQQTCEDLAVLLLVDRLQQVRQRHDRARGVENGIECKEQHARLLVQMLHYAAVVREQHLEQLCRQVDEHRVATREELHQHRQMRARAQITLGTRQRDLDEAALVGALDATTRRQQHLQAHRDVLLHAVDLGWVWRQQRKQPQADRYAVEANEGADVRRQLEGLEQEAAQVLEYVVERTCRRRRR